MHKNLQSEGDYHRRAPGLEVNVTTFNPNYALEAKRTNALVGFIPT